MDDDDPPRRPGTDLAHQLADDAVPATVDEAAEAQVVRSLHRVTEIISATTQVAPRESETLTSANDLLETERLAQPLQHVLLDVRKVVPVESGAVDQRRLQSSDDDVAGKVRRLRPSRGQVNHQQEQRRRGLHRSAAAAAASRLGRLFMASLLVCVSVCRPGQHFL